MHVAGKRGSTAAARGPKKGKVVLKLESEDDDEMDPISRRFEDDLARQEAAQQAPAAAAAAAEEALPPSVPMTAAGEDNKNGSTGFPTAWRHNACKLAMNGMIGVC